MVVAAIDAAKHGARSWCSKNTVTGVSVGCATGVDLRHHGLRAAAG